MSQEPDTTGESETRQRRHQKKRREQGLCGREGCEIVTGPKHYYCSIHRKEHRDAAKRRLRERREARLAGAAVTG